MGKETINALIQEARDHDSELQNAFQSQNGAATYAGEEPRRTRIEARHLEPYSAEADAAEEAVPLARKQVSQAIDAYRSRRAVRLWFRRLAGFGTPLCIPQLPAEILTYWRSYRQTRHRLLEARAKRSAKVMDLLTGSSGTEVDAEMDAASAQHHAALVSKHIAIGAQAAIAKERAGLQRVVEWLTWQRSRLDGSRSLTPSAEQRARAWIKAKKAGSSDAAPILRIRPEQLDYRRFRDVARQVRGAWLSGVPGLASTIDADPQVVRNALKRIGVVQAETSAGVTLLEQLWNALENPRAFDPDVKALLYWVASAAEIAMIGELTGKTHEEPASGILLSRLRDSAKTLGAPLFEALGYGKGFPCHVARFEVDKVSEAEVGADLGIILQIGLDDREICRAGLLQVKLAKNGRANIHRGSETKGNMHQLQALTHASGAGYYLFIDQDPVTGPPAAVVCAEVIAERLRAQHDVADIRDLAHPQCTVTCSKDSVDFGTFLGFTLLESGAACTSMLDAVRRVGASKANKIAAKLLIVQIGTASLEQELKSELGKLGYRESSSRPSIAEMAHRAGLGRDAGIEL